MLSSVGSVLCITQFDSIATVGNVICLINVIYFITWVIATDNALSMVI